MMDTNELIRRITELESRLEVDPKHPYDGIYCRDESIRQLQRQLDRPSRVVIGEFEISDHELGIAIYRQDGEGGIFNKEEFLKVIDKFYADNF